ncbi:HAD family hydrolase [Rhizobium leguminosarum]|uniref:Haloacid dehalogenase superfamily protein, subfamily IA, variant 3 with third motif having DD or ED n=2 Tax=Rhizobium TaxID=379 RepID=A0A2K9ZCN3_RHILE|nr:MULTISPECIES: HAD-IA family hydrolase [Rhizobium]AUW45960.1 Haloacid dehalogenase superfamily protein, subfamily IA, variant 3 with third motif having DD or ED [Rhizobium leguminosarum]NKL66457.1 HAD-IA family hydrolase [Rhizobium leguminosarum bv. viciae]TAU38028.1 HAD family hydrolase [Rhizobium leguminosarum]TBC54698.1 HAD family hydrolase [Rhizobium leguminosarum]TBC86628.1 HAD family hydrolase [Rhizobium leguminosarum]
MTGDRALILDFGGVVTRTLFETHDVTERALGLAAGTLTWRGPFDTTTDPLWVSMQSREITERDYWMTRTAEVGRLVGEEWTDMKTFVQRARGADADLVLRPEARDAITRAKAAGLRLAILSNELDLFYGVEFRKRFTLIDLFDVIVDATYTKILKPDPRAYEQVIAEVGLPREACVFVDDQPKNIEGATAVKLPNVHFDVTRPADGYARALSMLGL